MPPKKHQRLSKKEYLLGRIDVLTAEIYQNEVARDYILLLDEDKRTAEQKKSINAAEHNIKSLQKQIEWLEVCLG